MSPLGRRSALIVCAAVFGCSGGDMEPSTSGAPAIEATNAFYYYADVNAAHAFYSEILDFETVVDYGFAKIMRVAPYSYLTLVDAAEGMHSADEPKSVTLAVVTEQVEGWYAYLRERGVPMHSEFTLTEGRPHDGFVAVDPEGYFLEFERFNPHEENTALLPRMARTASLGPASEARPAELHVQATVLWLYYNDIPAMESFWERLLEVDLLVDQGWAKVYAASPTGYIGLVDGTRGLHEATVEKGVTVSFFTDDVDAWLDRARALQLELRTPDIVDESGRVRVFVGYDPEGYFLEWDTFLDLPDNQRLTALLAR